MHQVGLEAVAHPHELHATTVSLTHQGCLIPTLMSVSGPSVPKGLLLNIPGKGTPQLLESIQCVWKGEN